MKKITLSFKKLPALKPAKVVEVVKKKVISLKPIVTEKKKPKVIIDKSKLKKIVKEVVGTTSKVTRPKVYDIPYDPPPVDEKKKVVTIDQKVNQLAKKFPNVDTLVAGALSTPLPEVKPLKWTIPTGVIMSAAMAYFVREWKNNNPDAKRLLALQAEAFGVQVPMHTDNEHLDSIQQEIFGLITKGKKLSVQQDSLKRLLSWPGFNGGFIQ